MNAGNYKTELKVVFKWQLERKFENSNSKGTKKKHISD